MKKISEEEQIKIVRAAGRKISYIPQIIWELVELQTKVQKLEQRLEELEHEENSV